MTKEYIEDVQVGDTLYVVTPSRKPVIKVKECKVYDVQNSVNYLYIFTRTNHKLNLVMSFDKMQINDNLVNGAKTYYKCDGLYQRAFYEKKHANKYAVELIDAKIAELEKIKKDLENE